MSPGLTTTITNGLVIQGNKRELDALSNAKLNLFLSTEQQFVEVSKFQSICEYPK